MIRAQSCSWLLLFWSAAVYCNDNPSTTVKTVEFDFGKPDAHAHGVSPMLHPPPPQKTQAALAVGIGTAAAAAAGGVGMAIYAAHEANKPEKITKIVTPAPKVVYVPARVVIDVLDNGWTAYPPITAPPMTTPSPLRLYEAQPLQEKFQARKPVDFGHKVSEWNRSTMIWWVFGLGNLFCCCGCLCVAALLFTHCNRKTTRASRDPRKMGPAATSPEKRIHTEMADTDEVNLEDTVAFKPTERLGFTIDEETGMIYDVVEGGQAERLGIRDGDVIEFINGFDYDHELLKAYEDGEKEFDITLTETRKEEDFAGYGVGDLEMREFDTSPSSAPLMGGGFKPPTSLHVDTSPFRNITFAPPGPPPFNPYYQPTYAQPYLMGL